MFAACALGPGEANVEPGINDDFTRRDLDVDAMVKRFAAESPENFAHRAAIARAAGRRAGIAVADVGAGTGVFVDFFAQDVTASGRVHVVEFAPRFVEHRRQRAAARAFPLVDAVLGDGRHVRLPTASVHVVFACDTYHHFECQRSTLDSIHRAPRDGGTFVVVDFERIPGSSRPWILGHVRCGKEMVIAEIPATGFALAAQLAPGLRENYCLRFQKRAHGG